MAPFITGAKIARASGKSSKEPGIGVSGDVLCLSYGRR